MERNYYELNSQHLVRIGAQRARVRTLKNTRWWKLKLQRALCDYCQKPTPASLLTLDHIVPLARGGDTRPGNCAASCHACNALKGLDTPVDRLFRQLETGND